MVYGDASAVAVPLKPTFGKLHRKEETLRYLEEAYDVCSPGLAWVQHSPEFDFLHTDERYRSLIQRIGLPPAYRSCVDAAGE